MAAAVKVTLGPKGRNVVIDKKFGSPTVTKDGVTVAKEIELEDPYENMGAQMVKEVATKTTDVAGDGTTTATVLAQAIFREGLKNVTAGANPMALKRGIDKAVEAVVEELKKMSKSTKDKKEIAQVATIAANNDNEIGKPDRRGHGEGRQGRRHHRRGGQDPRTPSSTWSRACSSTAATSRPYFVTNAERMEAELEDALHPDPREEDQRDQGHAARCSRRSPRPASRS